MNKKQTRILSIILAIIIFAGAFFVYYYRPFSEDASPPATEEAVAQPAAISGPGATPVCALVVRTGTLQDAISVNGSTVSEEEVVITSEVAGKITQTFFAEGRYVKKGDPIVKLDTEELEAQRQRLFVQKELTAKIAERLKNLYDREGVSLQEYEIAEAEAEQVIAELSLLEVQIDKRMVRAPFSGILGLKQVSEGSYVSPGTPIINLVSLNPIHLVFSIPEKYSQSIDRGTDVEFQLDGLPGRRQATVIAKDPNIDANTRTLRVKAATPNPKGAILPGAYANVTVNLKNYDATILVPTQSIVPELGGKKVFVVRNGKAEAVPVETGIRQDTYIQVLEGLEEGDTIITTGVLQIRSGAEVSITELSQSGTG